MNISYVNELVWLAPERCATKITKKIFENYKFYSIREINGYKPETLVGSKHSHSNYILEEYKNWKIILNTRNPYDFVFSIFINKHNSRPITKLDEGLKDSFNHWIKISFLNHKNYVFLCPYYSEKNSFFIKWKFNEDFNPDFLIRTENICDDFMKLPFIESETDEKKEEIKSLLQDNGFINRRYVTFDELYDINSAKLIYEYFKVSFNKFGYSPFSFTKKILSEDEKNEFISGELE